ncbi:MAG: OmpA family protein [Actinomycetia bacterium]|nr:OmpA family protein [Actinomycetes bacterium]
MSSILEALFGVLEQGDTMARLGTLMDTDADKAKEGVGAAGPAVIGALASNAVIDGGAEPIAELVDSVGPSILDDVDGFLDADETALGTGLLDFLFGEDRGALLAGLSSNGDVPSSGYSKLLPYLAPLVVGAVAKRKVDDGLDADGLAIVLSKEQTEHEDEGDLGQWFSDAIAGGGALAAIAGLATLARAKLGDAAGVVSDIATEAVDKVEDAVEAVGDLLGEAGDKVGDLAGDAADKVGDLAGDAADKVGDLAGDAADKVGAGFDALTGRSDADTDTDDGATDTDTDNGDTDDGATDTDGATDNDDGDSDGGGMMKAAAITQDLVGSPSGNRSDGDASSRGLGWFWWALGGLVLLLFLVWLVGQLARDDDATATESTLAAEVADEADQGDGTAGAATETETETGSGTETGTETESDDEASDDAAAGNDDAEDEGSAEPEVDLADGVAGALTDAGFDGVSASVEGDVVTLSGSVGSEDDLVGAEAAVGAVDGVGSVVNEITVDDGDSGGDSTAAAGSSLNELLGLAPVTYGYQSARVTAEGQVVLAQVVEYLTTEDVDVEVEIQGHTDSDGTDAENLVLGQRRADAIKAYLEANGIDGDRLTAVGIGEGQPKVDNDSLDNKTVNRRIEFIVAG